MRRPPLITPEAPADFEAVEALIHQAFGPGRYAKAAERLREGNHPLLDISVVARDGARIVGCARMWPVKIGAAPAVLLGPFAVADDQRGAGLGRALVAAACEAAAKAGHSRVILVGDAAFFERVGFQRVDPRIALPGPVDMSRVLIRELKAGAALDLKGPVTVG